MTHDSRRASRKGFSLVELLTVITIISLVTALSVQGLAGVGGSAGRLRQSVTQTASLLSQARMLAISQNTYVYVFFQPDQARRRVDVMMVYSRTGINPWRGASATPLPAASGDLAPAHLLVTLEDTQLLERSAAPTQGDFAIVRPQPAFVMDLSSSYQLSHQNTVYGKSVVFRPTGEVYVPPLSYTGVVELVLGPATAEIPEQSAAVLQIVGATGQTRVYQR